MEVWARLAMDGDCLPGSPAWGQLGCSMPGLASLAARPWILEFGRLLHFGAGGEAVCGVGTARQLVDGANPSSAHSSRTRYSGAHGGCRSSICSRVPKGLHVPGIPGGTRAHNTPTATRTTSIGMRLRRLMASGRPPGCFDSREPFCRHGPTHLTFSPPYSACLPLPASPSGNENPL